MNKQTFLELMKVPEKISEADFIELETLVKANPYFQHGHSILAHASRKLKKASSPKKMSTAAIYATNRNIFKQYILGQIKFSKSQSPVAPAPKKTAKPQAATSTDSVRPRKAPTQNTNEEQSALVKEIYENLEKWKASREHYLDYDRKHPEEIVIEDPFVTNESKEAVTQLEEPQATVTPEPQAKEEAKIETEEPKAVESDAANDTAELDEVEKLKNQVAEEIEAEDKSISKALSELTEKSKTEEKADPVSKEPKPKEKPKPSNFSISSDELTAIVDAESFIVDGNEESQETEDSVADIEQSIQIENKDIEAPIVEDTIVEKAKEPVDASDIQVKEEPELIEEKESLVEEIESKSVAKTESQKEEEDIEASIQIDTTSDKSTEETEEELDQIGKEIQELKLNPGSTPTGKKFRLGILKRGTKFTKAKVKKSAQSNAPKKSTPKANPKSETQTQVAKKATPKKATTTAEKSESKPVAKTTKAPASKTKKATAAKKPSTTKKAEAKKAEPEKKEIKKKPPTKTEAPIAAKKAASPKAEAKKETPKKAAPKFRISATLGAKNKKKTTTTKKAPKKDEDSSSEKKKPKKVDSVTKETIDQSQVIDSFIELSPSIKINKDKSMDESTEDLSITSTTFPKEVVTENLANILLGQGKTESAITLIHKLIKQNPKNKEYYLAKVENIRSTSKSKPIDKEKKLFDDFVINNPTIIVSTWKDVVELIEEVVKKKSTLDERFVTENTAEILVHEGNKNKAKLIYEKLILKNPQKKAYFASQIEKLNKK